MTNLFVTNSKTEAPASSYEDDMDLGTCLEHPRVTKVTIAPDGTLVAELSTPAKADDIVRKSEGLHKANKTGFRGVSLRGKKYRADISVDGRQRNLGSFETMQEAVRARVEAELEL